MGRVFRPPTLMPRSNATCDFTRPASSLLVLVGLPLRRYRLERGGRGLAVGAAHHAIMGRDGAFGFRRQNLQAIPALDVHGVLGAAGAQRRAGLRLGHGRLPGACLLGARAGEFEFEFVPSCLT